MSTLKLHRGATGGPAQKGCVYDVVVELAVDKRWCRWSRSFPRNTRWASRSCLDGPSQSQASMNVHLNSMLYHQIHSIEMWNNECMKSYLPSGPVSMHAIPAERTNNRRMPMLLTDLCPLKTTFKRHPRYRENRKERSKLL